MSTVKAICSDLNHLQPLRSQLSGLKPMQSQLVDSSRTVNPVVTIKNSVNLGGSLKRSLHRRQTSIPSSPKVVSALTGLHSRHASIADAPVDISFRSAFRQDLHEAPGLLCVYVVCVCVCVQLHLPCKIFLLATLGMPVQLLSTSLLLKY